MKISLRQLNEVASKMRYSLLGYSNAEKIDLEVEVELITADPGLGKLIDCIKLTASAPKTEGEDVERSMVVEIYPYSEQEDPRASKIESFKVNGKY